MIKTLVMIHCDNCDNAFSEVVTVINSSELPRYRLRSLFLTVEKAGWQSYKASTAHVCSDCLYPEDDDLEAESDQDAADNCLPF